ncbi:MAG TPA: hypothetical protein HA330_00760 [Candidatus Thalassarchaeaceae archaeon]|nr:MAG TPA: hypothetical protein D7H85_00770 [Candidatus Poseidoniales archaeon]HII48393.1 hypothetical protein [Candidatus Thalassarchaeaceae archaeon]
MRSLALALLGLFFLAGVASAEIYIPGPTRTDMMDPNMTYEYTLPEWMNSACQNNLACRYETVGDQDIVHTYYGLNQGGTMELVVIKGEAQTYNITVSDLEIVPDKLEITTGSTLVFTVAENSSNANIILPWNPDNPEPESTPGFGAELILFAIAIALIRRR